LTAANLGKGVQAAAPQAAPTRGDPWLTGRLRPASRQAAPS
jgi:hypothetical protein